MFVHGEVEHSNGLTSAASTHVPAPLNGKTFTVGFTMFDLGSVCAEIADVPQMKELKCCHTCAQPRQIGQLDKLTARKENDQSCAVSHCCPFQHAPHAHTGRTASCSCQPSHCLRSPVPACRSVPASSMQTNHVTLFPLANLGVDMLHDAHCATEGSWPQQHVREFIGMNLSPNHLKQVILINTARHADGYKFILCARPNSGFGLCGHTCK